MLEIIAGLLAAILVSVLFGVLSVCREIRSLNGSLDSLYTMLWQADDRHHRLVTGDLEASTETRSAKQIEILTAMNKNVELLPLCLDQIREGLLDIQGSLDTLANSMPVEQHHDEFILDTGTDGGEASPVSFLTPREPRPSDG